MQTLDYDAPGPKRRPIHVRAEGDDVVLWIDDVRREWLWREALAPVIVLCPLAVALVWLITSLVNDLPVRHLPVPSPVTLKVAAVLALGAVTVWLLRDTYQNTGVVTEIAVRRGEFVWTKQNLWGPRTVVWPVESVRRATVFGVADASFLLVHRTRGTTLNAFANRSQADLAAAAEAINIAVTRQQERLVAFGRRGPG